ncbi:MAG TPA: menaquinone biosynthesis protein [Vicingaceae bacterium]
MNYKISAVSYANTYPFLYALKNSDLIKDISLSLDYPALCAEKLLTNQVDIGLVPIAILPKLKEYHIISDYCIGAIGKVKSVLLLSDVPLNEIKTIWLDYQSKTSINLTKVLAANYWKINPEWQNTTTGFEAQISGTTAGVIIGDRTFKLEKNYQYSYDLSEEWQKFTGLPFVFACWVANKKIDVEFLNQFNRALSDKMFNTDEVLNYFNIDEDKKAFLTNYLKNDISYHLDEAKRNAIEKFLNLLPKSLPIS